MFGSKFADFTIFFILLIGTLIAGYFYNGYHYIWIILASITYICILAWGSFRISLNFYLKSLNKLPRFKINLTDASSSIITARGKEIMLSFDDGPHPIFTPQILNILKQENIKALFFVIGKNATTHPKILQRIAYEGHSIGNHTYNHANNFALLKTQDVIKELITTNDTITNITGTTIKFFRPPFGVTNPRIAKAVAHTEMTSVGWDVRSYDTVAKEEAKLIQQILRKTQPGSIILLHDRCEITAKILPELIQQLRQKGYNFTII